MIFIRHLYTIHPYTPITKSFEFVFSLESNSINILKLMENPINLAKLKDMIKNGISRIPKDPNADEAIIVIGDTGVGKSTILAFLSGA